MRTGGLPAGRFVQISSGAYSQSISRTSTPSILN